MSQITTHVLDLALGRPAAGVEVVLERREGADWRRLGGGATDADGRLRTLQPEGAELAPASYRLTFSTGAYFSAQGLASFHPQVIVVFTVADGGQHHHVPLLVSPFGYTTYRGS
jgi:5-hydroxyisourate hydrolase